MNILLILSDQHNRRFMGCAGHPFVKTPHLNSLAEEGVLFSQAYCPSPLCGPSRMSLLSGLYPYQSGVYANAQPLPSDIPTFAHALGGLGYETALAGRMHFTGPDQTHGFEDKLGGDVTPSSLGGGLAPQLDGLEAGTHPNALKLSGPGDSAYLHYDDMVTDVACEWLAKQTSQSPFCLTVGFALPHNPFICSPRDFDAYKGMWKSSPRSANEHPILQAKRAALLDDGKVSEEDVARSGEAYCGLVTDTDRRIGRLLHQLEKQGLKEDTLVIYTSDHGEMAGEHGVWFKSLMYEGSAGVPLLMRYPGSIPAGRVLRSPVSLIDLTATLLDLAGAPNLPQSLGQSLRCLWEGKEPEGERMVFSEYGTRWGQRALSRMLRKGPWKYTYHDGEMDELYHMDDDPDETCNLLGRSDLKDLEHELLQAVLDGWDPQKTNAHLDLWNQRNKVLFDWFASRPRPDKDLYRGPEGCNRVEAVEGFEAKPVTRIGMY